MAAAKNEVLEFAPHVLEEIRAHCVAGAGRLRGGLEVGGLLAGTRTPDGFAVSSQRTFEPEYSFGPRFALSDKDIERFRTGLPESAVGWFRSARGEDLSLTQRDRDLAGRLFGGQDSLILIVRPSQFGPALCHAYRAAGGVRFERLRDFEIEAPKRRPRTAAAPAPAVPPPASAPTFAPPASAPTFAAAEPGAPQAPVQEPPAFSTVARDAILVPAPPPPIVGRRSMLLAAAACLVLLLAGWAVVRNLAARAVSGRYTLKLTAQDDTSNLRLAWDRKSEAVRTATGASVWIEDGGVEKRIHFDRDLLETGSFVYARSTGDVTVRLRVDCRCPVPVQEMVRFMGAAPARAIAEQPAFESREADRPGSPVHSAVLEAPPSEQKAGKRERPAELRLKTPASRVRESAPLRAFRPSFDRPAGLVPILEAPQVTSQVTSAPVILSRPQQLNIPPPVQRGHELRYKTPARGRLIWSGQLSRNQELVIDGNHASSGTLRGALPDGPLRVSVYPADFASGRLVAYVSTPSGHARDRWEPASLENGWNSTLFRFDPDRASGVIAVETPQPSNRWRKLIIRTGDRGASMILVDWRTAGGS